MSGPAGTGRTAPAEARSLRLFLAVDVPDETKAALEQALAPYRSRVPGARWTGRDGWHLTLKFLGATPPRLLEPIRGAAAAVARGAAPMRAALTEIGAFPTPRRPRVVWAGVGDAAGGPSEGLVALAAGLDEALGEWFVPEHRAFTPHLTVARLGTPRDLAEHAPGLVGLPVSSAPFPVDRLVLYRSHLSRDGARYEPVDAWGLGKPGDAAVPREDV